jgi:hypothetical protein
MSSFAVDRWQLGVAMDRLSANGQLPTANREVAD